MYSLQKGFRTGSPELTEVGGHDWVREFNTYYVRAQDRHHNGNDPWSNYSVQGRIYDTYCDNHSVTCSYGGGRLAQHGSEVVYGHRIPGRDPHDLASKYAIQG